MWIWQTLVYFHYAFLFLLWVLLGLFRQPSAVFLQSGTSEITGEWSQLCVPSLWAPHKGKPCCLQPNSLSGVVMMVFVDYLLFDPCAGSRVTWGMYSGRLSHEIVVNELTSWRLMTNGISLFPKTWLLSGYLLFVSCFFFISCFFYFFTFLPPFFHVFA